MTYRISPGSMVIALAILGAACSADNQDTAPGGAGTTGATGGAATTGTTSTTGTAGMTSTAGSTGSVGGAAGTSVSAVTTGSGGAGSGGSTGSACTEGDASGTAPNTLTVNVDSAQTVIGNGIFGLLMERLGRDINGGLFVGESSNIPNTGGMRNDIIQGFKDAGVGIIEWPGGCAANGYSWNPPNPTNDMGTDRYMQLTSLLGTEPYIAGPGTAAAANSSLQWLTYINDNSTHPDWNLKYFKVGNEVWGCGGNQTEATYESNYLANYNALSAPIDGKKVSLVASTGYINNTTWLDTEVKNLGSKIDGIEVHDYVYHPSDIPCVGFSDSQYYNIVNAANGGQIGPRLNQITAILDKYDAGKRIKIFEDEWGDWLEPFNSAQDTWLQQITVMDAISSAEQLHLFMQHTDRIQMAGLAQAINVIHSLFLTRSSDGALVKTPAFYVFKMFLPHHASNAKWAPNTLTSENITGNNATFPVLSAGTTVDSQGRVNISLANVDLVNSRTIRVTLNSSKASYSVSSAEVITGPAKDTYNDFAQQEKVNIQPFPASSCTVSGKSLKVTLPSKSVVMLVLTPQ